jgi:hypothetical protein
MSYLRTAILPAGLTGLFMAIGWLSCFSPGRIFPDLHRLAAARTRIAITLDDDRVLSLPFPSQIAPYENTNARKMRASARTGNLEAGN